MPMEDEEEIYRMRKLRKKVAKDAPKGVEDQNLVEEDPNAENKEDEKSEFSDNLSTSKDQGKKRPSQKVSSSQL